LQSHDCSTKFRRVFFTYNLQEDSPPPPGHNTPAPLTHNHSLLLANHFARFAFPISDSLPFIDVPIGRVIAENGHTQDYLCGLADTGGCCTMAWKPYMFFQLKDKFPEYVEEHMVLKERQFKDIKIGGIQGGVFITDVMPLYLPFTSDGKNLILDVTSTATSQDGTLCMSPQQYIDQMATEYERMFGTKPHTRVTSPLEKNDHPETDDLELLDKVGIQRYQSLIGSLQWAVSLGRDTLTEPNESYAQIGTNLFLHS
jgi:hypothetical protein